MAYVCRISEVIRQLKQHQNDDFVLYLLLCTDDVRSIDASATEEEAIATLQHADRHYDTDLGINRDTLEAALDAVRQEGPLKTP